MSSTRILIVTADAAERRALVDAVSAAGFEPVVSGDAETALAHHAHSVRAAIVDVQAFEDEALGELVERDTDLPCIVLAGDGGIAEAVDLMRQGAFSVLPTPIHDDNAQLQIEAALRHRELAEKNADLERSLEVHERLAMIGKLAAGVAHELNNPLDGVLRYINLSVDSLPSDAPQIPYLAEARRGLRRMADIVRDLLQFSRNAAVEIADEDAERLARDAVKQVVAQVPHKRIETRFEFPAGGLPLPRAMFQVIGNVAKNAVDSMPNGGSLSVSADVRDNQIRIRVADSGPGIPDEIRERVFEPFFTTKEVGQGTGLGLSICQRIVERLGGTLSLDSEVGHGTTVIVHLPTRRRLQATRVTTPIAHHPHKLTSHPAPPRVREGSSPR